MATTTSNKRKKAVAATVAAAALLLGGTFAWTSISQQALNESAGIVNVGGRLHDDFNGENKDVYVENFTSADSGGQPIYARVRLDEYMEVGQEAGSDTDLDNDGKVEATPVLPNTSKEDPSSWVPHVPAAAEDGTVSCAYCASEGTCAIHEHWTWRVGGSTEYMPTFNKDKDSKEADINGTYDGTNLTDKVYYDDYVTYVTTGGVTVDMNDADFVQPDGATEATPLTEKNQPITKVTGAAYYDNDTDTAKNETEGSYRTQIETHEAKATASGTVITMEEWLFEDGYNCAPGNYWVYDDDGWAYWANPIMPGQATGLLLDEIKMVKNPGEKCYYAINVVGEFATAEDWSYFNDGEGLENRPNAKLLMETAAASVPTVTVDGESYVEAAAGQTYQFTATAARGGISLNSVSFKWSVMDGTGREVDADTAYLTENENGAALTIGESVPHETTLYVVAESLEEAYLGASGAKAVMVQNEDAMTPGITIDEIDTAQLDNISSIPLTAKVKQNFADVEDADITWSVDVADIVAKIVDGNKLQITQAEGEAKVTVTASCEIDGYEGTKTMEITIDASLYCDTCGTKYPDSGICEESSCTNAGEYQPAVLNDEGEYEVANAGQMFYMARMINEDDANLNTDITLVDDIDLSNQEWTAIGGYARGYQGVFDGQNHKITGLAMDVDTNYQGFFSVTNGATVKDTSFDGEIKVDVSTGISRIGLIGQIYGNSVISNVHSDIDFTLENPTDGIKATYFGGIGGSIGGNGTQIVENCSYTGTISGKFETAAGICGYGEYTTTFTIRDCLFAGSILQTEETANSLSNTVYVGGMLGYYNAAGMGTSTIENCLSVGTIAIGDGSSTELGALVGVFRDSALCTASNLHYLLTDSSSANIAPYGYNNTSVDTRPNAATETRQAAASELTDNTVCNLLNNGGSAWTQGESYPKPNQW